MRFSASTDLLSSYSLSIHIPNTFPPGRGGAGLRNCLDVFPYLYYRKEWLDCHQHVGEMDHSGVLCVGAGFISCLSKSGADGCDDDTYHIGMDDKSQGQQ